MTELGKQLQPYLKITETLPPVVEETKPAAPRCTKCGSDIVLCMAKSGSIQRQVITYVAELLEDSEAS